MINVKQINKIKVLPIPHHAPKPEEILGYDLFEEIYSNIFLCAKKNSGKTCAIFTILKNCINKNSTVYIFASTVNNDSNWLHIIEWLRKKQINYTVETDLNNLNDFVKYLQSPQKEINSIQGKKDSLFNIIDTPDKVSHSDGKTEFIAPENVFIFDDMSKMLRDESVSCLLKKNRHFKSKVILSSQYPNDLDIPARKQIDYWLIFKGHSEQKLKQIHSDMDLEFNFNKFLALYNYATREKYNFLYVDTRHNKYRKNFNIELSIRE